MYFLYKSNKRKNNANLFAQRILRMYVKETKYFTYL